MGESQAQAGESRWEPWADTLGRVRNELRRTRRLLLQEKTRRAAATNRATIAEMARQRLAAQVESPGVAVCCHCGHRHTDAAEWDVRCDSVVNCYGCDRPLSVKRSVAVTYQVRPVGVSNG